jgi:hypothetical protein
VSFNRRLFEKELKKALIMLKPAEIEELKHWCYSKFSKSYEPELNKYFVRLAS